MNLPQIVAAGIYNSDIAAKNVKLSKNRKTSMFEIELPIEESGISYIDSEQTPVSTNMVICAKPGQIRHTRFPFRCFYVHMILSKGILYDTLMNAPVFVHTGKHDFYKSLFERITHHYNTPGGNDEIILQSLMLELIYTIGNDSAKTRKKSDVKPTRGILIENVIEYIASNITENLSLENVADKFYLSPIYFHNSFKAATGKTLRDYVEEVRIKKALHLLTTTNYSLTKIAYECGFSSQSYFSFAFKRRMKKTPREYVREVYSKYEI